MTPDRRHPHRRRHGDGHRRRRRGGAAAASSQVGVMVAFVLYRAAVLRAGAHAVHAVHAHAAGHGRRLPHLRGAGRAGDHRRTSPDAVALAGDRARPSSSTTSPSATIPTGRCCTTSRFKVKPRQVVALVGPDRLGQDLDHLAGAPLLRGRPGPGAGGRPRRARRDPGEPRPDHRHGAAGAVPVHRHHRGEHPLQHSGATHEEIVAAAKAVRAHDFIMRLPEGYDTQLGQRGRNISLGQRQLLSFARALVADPQILILDEATANIDSFTELEIQQALKVLFAGRTCLVIAHRLATIRDADEIIVLQQGRIVEQGAARRADGQGRPLRQALRLQPRLLRRPARRGRATAPTRARLRCRRKRPLPEGEGGAQSEANGKVRGYRLTGSNSNSPSWIKSAAPTRRGGNPSPSRSLRRGPLPLPLGEVFGGRLGEERGRQADGGGGA